MHKSVQGFVKKYIMYLNVMLIFFFYIYSVRYYIVIITYMNSFPQGSTQKSPYISTNPVYTSLPSHGPPTNRPAMVSASPPINTIDP